MYGDVIENISIDSLNNQPDKSKAMQHSAGAIAFYPT
jgi:hypothetical protein